MLSDIFFNQNSKWRWLLTTPLILNIMAQWPSVIALKLEKNYSIIWNLFLRKRSAKERNLDSWLSHQMFMDTLSKFIFTNWCTYPTLLKIHFISCRLITEGVVIVKHPMAWISFIGTMESPGKTFLGFICAKYLKEEMKIEWQCHVFASRNPQTIPLVKKSMMVSFQEQESPDSQTVTCRGFPEIDVTRDQILDFFFNFGIIQNVEVRKFSQTPSIHSSIYNTFIIS